jgi:hypothetical protein
MSTGLIYMVHSYHFVQVNNDLRISGTGACILYTFIEGGGGFGFKLKENIPPGIFWIKYDNNYFT